MKSLNHPAVSGMKSIQSSFPWIPSKADKFLLPNISSLKDMTFNFENI